MQNNNFHFPLPLVADYIYKVVKIQGCCQIVYLCTTGYMRQNILTFDLSKSTAILILKSILCCLFIFYNRIFLMIIMMLQKFQLLPADGEPKPQTDPRDPEFAGFGIKQYKVQVQKRK